MFQSWNETLFELGFHDKSFWWEGEKVSQYFTGKEAEVYSTVFSDYYSNLSRLYTSKSNL